MGKEMSKYLRSSGFKHDNSEIFQIVLYLLPFESVAG